MKKIESLHFLTSLIEIHEIKEYWQECAGQYYVIDIVTLFTKLTELQRSCNPHRHNHQYRGP